MDTYAPMLYEDTPETFFEIEDMPSKPTSREKPVNAMANAGKSSSRNNAENGMNNTDGSTGTSSGFSDVIDAINALHFHMAACGLTMDFKLPQIVVVGPEDSGKSSVLQGIVGKNFLPKGSGLVTRRPTVIQLIPTSDGEEYGVFAHVPEEEDGKKKRFYDFAAIAQEIEDETNKLGPKCFSSVPINLTIYSPRVLKLTLVDLPGIVEVPVSGQEVGSISTVKDMVLENIQDPNTLILAIIPANHSIASSLALSIANKVDPNRERTIGVLTKLDLMEAGTNALNILENHEVELKRGYVGVVNAGYKDVEKKTDFASILENERKFFQRSCYSHLAHRMGIPYLQKMLQKTLRQHIKERLPELRNDLSLRLSRIQRELKTFEETIGQGREGNNFYIINLVQKFIKVVCTDLFGYSDMVNSETIKSGKFIHHKMYTEVQTYLNLDLQADKKELTIIVANLCGLRNPIGVPSQSKEALCRKLLSKFKEPLQLSLNCIKQVLVDSVIESTQMMERYPSLRNEVIFCVQRCIDRLAQLAEERLLSHIDAEMFFVNTAHPDFDFSEWDSIAPTAGNMQYWDNPDSAPNQGTSKEELVNVLMNDEAFQKKTEYVSRIMMGYLKIIKKSILDLTIKYIAYFLVYKFSEFLEDNLVTDLLNSSNLKNLMQDCEQDFKQKADMEKKSAILQNFLKLIQEF